jgi:hypothetical protein
MFAMSGVYVTKGAGPRENRLTPAPAPTKLGGGDAMKRSLTLPLVLLLLLLAPGLVDAPTPTLRRPPAPPPEPEPVLSWPDLRQVLEGEWVAEMVRRYPVARWLYLALVRLVRQAGW